MSYGKIHRRPGFLLALGLCAVGGAVTLVGHLVVGPVAAPVRIPLANLAGAEACPSFSPDGRELAYGARGPELGGAFRIWIRALPKGEPQPLTHGPGSDSCPVWSPDGANIAFVRIVEGQARYAVIPAGRPASPSTEQVVAETVSDEDEEAVPPGLSWMPGGKSLALVKAEGDRPPAIFGVALDTGSARRITDPPAGSAGDFSPAVSPDGQTLAFVRGGQPDVNDIWLCDASGGSLRQLTFDARPIRGIAWTPDGRDLIYASSRVRAWRLWRIPAFGGSPRELVAGAKEANDPAIAPSAHRLAFTETPSASSIWLAPLPRESTQPREILQSAGQAADASWSPDGRQIVWISDQTGADEIWISDATGGARAQVTNLKGPSLGRPRWSPDGKTLLFTTRGMAASVYNVPATARMIQPLPLPLAPGMAIRFLTWAADGKAFFGESRGSIYKLVRGQPPQQLTHRIGGFEPAESPDGRYVYYWFRRSIWRVPTSGGAEEEVVEPGQWVFALQPVSKGIYYLGSAEARKAVLWFYDFATAKSRQVLRLNGEVSRDSVFDVSPDGASVLYSQIDTTRTELVLVENFR